jgi:saccharopine dehydrogenase-like NADP-dependent oxidoreductase
MLGQHSRQVVLGIGSEQNLLTVRKLNDVSRRPVPTVTPIRAASFLAYKMHEANLTLKQLFFLGLDDKETIMNKGFCSAADVLQFALEKKLALGPDDKDMIVMMHEIKFEVGGQQSAVSSLLVIKGEDNVRTAMAKTVGLPLGIATRLILNGAIKLKGLHIPTKKEIYEPVLKELEEQGIKFEETDN